MSDEFALNNTVASTSLPIPTRALLADCPVELFEFALADFSERGAAIATLVEIRGGAARALGSHVVVLADGRYAGYVSGGCVEAAIAFEALLATAEGRDRTVLFGDGSPFFDIVLPCGGGITVAIHVLRDSDAIARVLTHLSQRRSAALQYSPAREMLISVEPSTRAGW